MLSGIKQTHNDHLKTDEWIIGLSSYVNSIRREIILSWASWSSCGVFI